MMRKLLAARLAVGLAFSPVPAVASSAVPPPSALAGPAVEELALRAVGPAVKTPDRDAAVKALRDGVPWSEVVDALGLEELGRTADAVYRRMRHFQVPLPRILPGAEVTVDAAGQRVDCRFLRVGFGRGAGAVRMDLGGRYRLGEGAPRLDLALGGSGGNTSIRLEVEPGSRGVGAVAQWHMGKASFRVGAGGVAEHGGARDWNAGVGVPLGKKQRMEYSYAQHRHQAVWTHCF